MKKNQKSLRKRLFDFWNASKEYFVEARTVNVYMSEERKKMIDFIRQGSLVLDVACGTAENGRGISEFANYVGCDVSFLGLKMAKDHKNFNFEVVRSDAEFLAFKAETFDYVISTYSIEHFIHPIQALFEMHRVVAKKGFIILISPAWDFFSLPPSLRTKATNKLWRFRYSVAALLGEIREMAFDFFGVFRFVPRLITDPDVLKETYSSDNDTVYVVRVREVKRFFEYLNYRVLFVRKNKVCRRFLSYSDGLFIITQKTS